MRRRAFHNIKNKYKIYKTILVKKKSGKLSTHKCSHVTRVSSWITLRRRRRARIANYFKSECPLSIFYDERTFCDNLLLFSHIPNREKAHKLKNKSIKYFASACAEKKLHTNVIELHPSPNKKTATRKKRRVFIAKILNENARARLIEMENLHKRIRAQ